MPKHPIRWLIALLLALEAAVSCLSAATNAPAAFTVRRAAEGNLWSLSWPTQPGAQYKLQQSADLSVWVDVATLTGEGTNATHVAAGIPTQAKTFWRVLTFPAGSPEKGASQAVAVSPVIASYQLGTTQSRALLRVVTSGTQTVSRVMFFDNGMLLGNALPGIGNSWTFDLLWDGRTPQTRQISATVTTEEGTTNETAVSAFLLADPARFVPVGTNNTRAYGEFVRVDGNGKLDAFLFYPEGLGDAATVSGAYFEFPAGASLRSQGGINEIEFTAGSFYRGHRDTTPITASAGTHRIDIDAATPAAVAAALGISAGSVQLLWGATPVDWLSGALSERGWAALVVRPPIGNFLLPSGQECALVSFDPKSSDPTLIVCYHGSWRPFDGGPQFQIPRAEPLKIYLSLSGRIAAHGTVETIFSNGTTVRGSVSWRDPNFEVRLQGKNITIPALTSLKRALPANPEQIIPAGNTTAELDAAAQALASFRDTYRSLALGGLAEASTASAQTLAPLGEPTDQSGTALQAWASRLASWTADRAGQVLDAQQLADLGKVVANAAKMAEAAHDLPTALKLLRDFVVLQKNAPTPLGSSAEATALLSSMAEAQTRLLSSIDRLLGSKGTFPPNAELADTIVLLNSLLGEVGTNTAAAAETRGAARKSVAAGPSEDQLRQEVFRVALGVKDKFELGTFSKRKIVKNDFDGTDNDVLPTLSKTQLLDFLDEVLLVFELLKGNNPNYTAAQAPPQFPLIECVRQVQPYLAAKHNAATADAIQKKDARLLRTLLGERARIFRVYSELGITLPSDNGTYLPPTLELVTTFEPLFIKWLGGIAPNKRLVHYTDVVGMLAQLAAFTSDSVVDNHVASTWNRLSDFNRRFSSLVANDKHCDALARELADQGHTLMRLPLGNEGSQAVPITGKYESRPGPRGNLVTLQLNQAGRYVTGWLQHHGRGTPMSRFLLQGMLRAELPGIIQFGYLKIFPGTDANHPDQILSSGILTGRIVGQSVEVSLAEDDNGSVYLTEFVQTANLPALSENVVNLFTGEARNVLLAHQRSPLHSRETEEIAAAILAAKNEITNYFHGGTQLQIALDLNALVREAKRKLSSEHVPLLRHEFRRGLSLAVLDVNGNVLTYWEALLLIYNAHRNQMPDISDLLGIVPSQISSSQIFTYQFRIKQTSLSGDVGPGSLGTLGLDIDIRKTAPGGAQTTFLLTGQLLQGGAGPGLGVSFLSSEDVVTVRSVFDYELADFEGPITVSGTSGGLALLIGYQVGKSAFVFQGTRGLLPAMVVESGIDSFTVGFQVGLGADFSAGVLVPRSTYVNPTQVSHSAQPVRYQARNEALFEASLDFDVDAATISECGWQHLREFVAEYRAMFASPAGEITVLGFTDTTGSEDHNLQLSQNRANNVKEALKRIVGPLLRVTEANFRAVGLGETPARTIGNLPDGVDSPEWRRVTVIVNDLVSVNVDSPR